MSTNLQLSLDLVIRNIQQFRETDYYSLAKCNSIVNLTTLVEIHLQKKPLYEPDWLLDGDYMTSLFGRCATQGIDTGGRFSLLEIRNKFVHEGIIEDISDEKLEVFVRVTRSILSE